MTKKRSSSFFSGKIGVTPSVTVPGDTHPSDATDKLLKCIVISVMHRVTNESTETVTTLNRYPHA